MWSSKHSASFNYELLFLASLAAIIFATYYNSLFGAFIWDDRAAIISNKDVTGTRPWSSILSNDFWGQNIKLADSHKSYRPVTVFSFRLDHEIYGLNAFGFHVTNVVIYAVTCFAFYALSKQWLSDTGAKLASYIFTLHPIHVESVASVVGRADCLSGLFYILAIVVYQFALDTNSLLPFIVAWICALLSTFSKEIGFTIFAVFCGLELLHQLHAVMRQHPDFRWLRVSGELVRKKNTSRVETSDIPSQMSLPPVFPHPEEYLTGLLLESNWRKTMLVVKTAVDSRLNPFSTSVKQPPSNKLSQAQMIHLPPSSFISVPIPSMVNNIPLRVIPLLSWSRLCIHVITILLFFQFRAWLHGPQYMYQWTLMENHVALMPTFFPDRVLSYAQHHFWYFWKFVYPRHLCFDYGYECIPVVTSIWDWRNILPLSLYVGICVALVHALYRLRVTLLFGWALLLSSLLPALNIVMPVGNLLAERLMFVPSIGFCLLIADYITVDLRGFWYHSESCLWALLDAVDAFVRQFQVRLSDAVAASATRKTSTNSAEDHSTLTKKPFKRHKGAQHDTGNHPHAHHHNQHHPKHPLVPHHETNATSPKQFQLNDGLSVYVTSAGAKQGFKNGVDTAGESVTDGENSGSADDDNVSSAEEDTTAPNVSKGVKHKPPTNASDNKRKKSSLKDQPTTSPFAFLWSSDYWYSEISTIFTATADKAQFQTKQHPSAILYQGKMSLFLCFWPILALAMMRIVSRNLDWRSEFSIYTSALSVCPHSLKALSNTVVLMSPFPDYNAQAAAYADLSVALYANNSIGLINLGLAQQRQGHLLASVMALERAMVAQHPQPPPFKNEGYLSGTLYKWAMALPMGLTATGQATDDVRFNMMQQAQKWSVKGVNAGFQSPLMLYNAAAMATEVRDHDLAVTLYDLAIQKQQQANDQRRRSGNTIPFEDSISLCYAYNMFGLALSNAKRFQDAIYAYEKSIALHQQASAVSHEKGVTSSDEGCQDPLPATINLAQLLNQHLQRPRDARRVLQKYLLQYQVDPQWDTVYSYEDHRDNHTWTLQWLAQQPFHPVFQYAMTFTPLSHTLNNNNINNNKNDTWPEIYGEPIDWQLLCLVRDTVPPIVWNNLGFVEQQLGHAAVALEYYTRGLYTVKRLKERQQQQQQQAATLVSSPQSDTGVLLAPELPSILANNWQGVRRWLNVSDALPDEWAAVVAIDTNI